MANDERREQQTPIREIIKAIPADDGGFQAGYTPPPPPVTIKRSTPTTTTKKTSGGASPGKQGG